MSTGIITVRKLCMLAEAYRASKDIYERIGILQNIWSSGGRAAAILFSRKAKLFFGRLMEWYIEHYRRKRAWKHYREFLPVLAPPAPFPPMSALGEEWESAEEEDLSEFAESMVGWGGGEWR